MASSNAMLMLPFFIPLLSATAFLKRSSVLSSSTIFVIGSGGDLARLVIKQLNRSMTVADGSLHKLPVDGAISVSCYIINEVKESDSQSGGETKVMVIDSKGVKALSREEVQLNYDKFLGIMTVGLAPFGLSVENIKKLWPTG
jgi:hypothetical protein